MSQPGPVLAVHDLHLSIGGAVIIDGVSLSVPRGEMLGVIGPNGAGKTTLFNLLSGVMRPTAGTVHLAGDDVTARSVDARARAGLGRTFQTSSLFDGLTALENVRLAAQAALGGALSLVRFPGRGGAATERARDLGHAQHATESPLYAGRALAALAADPGIAARAGAVLHAGDLARVYGFTDADGTRPERFRVGP